MPFTIVVHILTTMYLCALSLSGRKKREEDDLERQKTTYHEEQSTFKNTLKKLVQLFSILNVIAHCDIWSDLCTFLKVAILAKLQIFMVMSYWNIKSKFIIVLLLSKKFNFKAKFSLWKSPLWTLFQSKIPHNWQCVWYINLPIW